MRWHSVILIAGIGQACVGDKAMDSSAHESAEETVARCYEDRSWLQVAAGVIQTCGLHGDGCIECWGGDELDGADETGLWYDFGDDAPPDGTYIAVALPSSVMDYGSFHGCALDEAGLPVCWGRNDEGQATPPDRVLSSLSLADTYSCGLNPTGEVYCWGDRGWIAENTPTEEGHTDLSAGMYKACAVNLVGDIACWTSSERQVDRAGPYATVSVESLVCAMSPSTPISCWIGNDGPEELPDGLPTDLGFVDLCQGRSDNGCAMKAEGEVQCWGSNYGTPPDANFVQISCGTYHVCGLSADGSILCWGKGCDDGQCDVPP